MKPGRKNITLDKRVKSRRKRARQQQIQTRPEMLLENVFFLNSSFNKYVSVGFLVSENCRPMIVLMHDLHFFTLLLTDWLAIFTFNTQIKNWISTDCNDSVPNDTWVASKNIKLTKVVTNERRVIQIESTLQNNCLITLNSAEFEKCIELDSYVQYLLNQMQNNYLFVDEYYNMYVYYCILNKKSRLSDEEYFTLSNFSNNIDSYKIFSEIPICCCRKLSTDLCV